MCILDNFFEFAFQIYLFSQKDLEQTCNVSRYDIFKRKVLLSVLF